MVKSTFRDGNYYRSVWIGKRTVKEGECAAIWGPSGRRKLIAGPQRVRLFFSHVRFLDRHVADQNQYLQVQFRDGRKEHHRGPQAWFRDPCVHLSISTHDAYKLSANECMVVYREAPPSEAAASHLLIADGLPAAAAAATSTSKDAVVDESSIKISAVGVPGSVQRRIVRGPAVFIPGAYEWVHEFSWHGTKLDDTGKGSKTGAPGMKKTPHALKFHKLRQMPDQTYISVESVRTVDDAQITVHLMVFYELKDVERMLDSTSDPMGDYVNATSADVMKFGAENTYETLLQRTAQLSDIATFPILASRMAQTGFELLKIVYRGYSAGDALQTMHDQAIAKRTKLKLEADTRQMEQAHMSMELGCKQERSKAEMELEAAGRKHQSEMVALESEQCRQAADADHAQSLRHEAEKESARLEALRKRIDEELRFNEALQGLGVDLTQYLCIRGEKEPDHHIRLDHGPGGTRGTSGVGTSTPAQLHLKLSK